MCARQTSISPIFLLNKITAPIFQIIHIQKRLLTLLSTLTRERRCKVQTHLQGLFNFWHWHQRKKPYQRGWIRSEWTKGSWDNARVQTNSALIVFTPCFNIVICSDDLHFMFYGKAIWKPGSSEVVKGGLTAPTWTHSCKSQCADTCWFMAYVH